LADKALVVDHYDRPQEIIYGDRGGRWAMVTTQPGYITPPSIIVAELVASGKTMPRTLMRIGTMASAIHAAQMEADSQRDLARRLNIDQSTLSNVVNGRRRTVPRRCLPSLVRAAVNVLKASW
jgi:hypothetical protein